MQQKTKKLPTQPPNTKRSMYQEMAARCLSCCQVFQSTICCQVFKLRVAIVSRAPSSNLSNELKPTAKQSRKPKQESTSHVRHLANSAQAGRRGHGHQPKSSATMANGPVWSDPRPWQRGDAIHFGVNDRLVDPRLGWTTTRSRERRPPRESILEAPV